MEAEAPAARLHQGTRHRLHQRLVGIFVLARAFEHIAAVDLAAAQVAGLSGNPAELLELVVIGLELVIADRIILDRHLGRYGAAAVALADLAARLVVVRQEPPGVAVPMRAGTAEIGARQERSE